MKKEEIIAILTKMGLEKVCSSTAVIKTLKVTYATLYNARKDGVLKRFSYGTYTVDDLANWLLKRPHTLATILESKD